MILSQFFAQRSAEDILAGRIPLVLDGKPFVLPVLKIDPEEAWVALLRERLNTMFGGLDTDGDPFVVLSILARNVPVELELLHAYDAKKVLPKDAWIREHVDSGELMRAVLGVAATAYPPLELFLQLLVEQPEIALEMIQTLRSALTSSSPSPTDGTSPTSEPPSPPSSSSATSTPASAGGPAKPRRSSTARSKPSGSAP